MDPRKAQEAADDFDCLCCSGTCFTLDASLLFRAGVLVKYLNSKTVPISALPISGPQRLWTIAENDVSQGCSSLILNLNLAQNSAAGFILEDTSRIPKAGHVAKVDVDNAQGVQLV